MWADANDRFDAQIDAVARHMTSAAPPADLRERVMARIPGADRPRTHLTVWMLSAAAIAVVIAVAILIQPGAVPAQRQPATPVVQAFRPASPRDGTPADSAHEPPSRSRASARPAGARIGQRTSGGGSVDANVARPSIDRFELLPLAVSPMQLTMIVPPEPELTEPLKMTPLSIAPLSSEGEK